MQFISEILERANLQQITTFLLYGAQSPETDRRPCGRRLGEERDRMLAALSRLIPDQEAREQILEAVDAYAAICQEAYLAIGVQAGAALTASCRREERE